MGGSPVIANVPDDATQALIQQVMSGGSGSGPPPAFLPAMWHVLPVPEQKMVVAVIRDPGGIKVTFCDPRLAEDLGQLFGQAAVSAASGITVASRLLHPNGNGGPG